MEKVEETQAWGNLGNPHLPKGAKNLKEPKRGQQKRTKRSKIFTESPFPQHMNPKGYVIFH